MLTMKILKVCQNVSAPILTCDINYNLRINSEFVIPKVRFVFHGSENCSYFNSMLHHF